jgi:hypothetical protein
MAQPKNIIYRVISPEWFSSSLLLIIPIIFLLIGSSNIEKVHAICYLPGGPVMMGKCHNHHGSSHQHKGTSTTHLGGIPSENKGRNTKSLQFKEYTDNPSSSPLYIVSHSVQKDFDKSYTVVGEVKNNGSVIAHYVEIISTLYNADNQTLDSIFAFTNPTDLTPGQSAPFDLSLRGSGMDITIPQNQIAYVKYHLDRD